MDCRASGWCGRHRHIRPLCGAKQMFLIDSGQSVFFLRPAVSPRTGLNTKLLALIYLFIFFSRLLRNLGTLPKTFASFFFFPSLPPSFLLSRALNLYLFKECGETCRSTSVNTSEVVPEFKSFTQRLADTTWGCLCDGKRRNLFRN